MGSLGAALALLAVLYGARSVSVTLFHALAEIFAIVITYCVFLVVWNGRRYIENGAVLRIGISCLAIASIDLAHLLSYRGIDVIPGLSEGASAQLWMAARAMQAIALGLAALRVRRGVAPGRLLAMWLASAALVLLATVALPIGPTLLNDAGPTPLLTLSQALVIALFVASLALLSSRVDAFEPEVLAWLKAAVGWTVVSEMALAASWEQHTAMHLHGHYLRIIAVYALYKAMIFTALREPHAVLFRELSLRTVALEESRRSLERAKSFSDALTTIDATVNATLELDEILERVTVDASRAIGADAAAVTLRQDTAWVVRHVYQLPTTLVGTKRDERSGRHLHLTATTKQPLVINDAEMDERVDPAFVQRYGIRALMTVPLVAGSDVIGVLTFLGLRPGAHFDEEQRSFAARLSVSVALAIENARLYGAQRHIAETLQAPMLRLPETLPGVRLGHAYRSADELARIGGDFYDAFELADGRIALVIGDVSGKGMDAATASSITRTTFHALALRESSPAAVLRAVNAVLDRLLPEGVFATATYGVIDIDAERMIAASAGHPEPFLCTAGGCVTADVSRNQPLGLFDDIGFDEFVIPLRPGDTVVLYSDGLLDARDGAGFFGEERIRAVLDGLRDASPQEVADALMEAVSAFANHTYTDDIAILAATIAAGR